MNSVRTLGYRRGIRLLTLAMALGPMGFFPGGTSPAEAGSTVVATPRPISTFAFEGHTIGWATEPCTFGSGRARFHVEDLATGRRLVFRSSGWGCGIVEAVTNRRVINLGADEAWEDWLETATLNRRHLARFDKFYYREPPGTNHGRVVSDARTFVYPWWSFDVESPDTCWDTGIGCDLVVTGGGLRRLVGPPPATRIPGAPPASLVSVSGGLVALQPYIVGSTFKTGNVQVRDVTTGEIVSSFATTGNVVGIALHRDTLAAMVRTPPHSSHIELRSATTGSLKSSYRVAAAAGRHIDLSGAGVLYRVGSRLLLLDPHGGTRQTVHDGHRPLLAWQIESRRLVWVVNGAGHGFIRTRVVSSATG